MRQKKKNREYNRKLESVSIFSNLGLDYTEILGSDGRVCLTAGTYEDRAHIVRSFFANYGISTMER